MTTGALVEIALRMELYGLGFVLTESLGNEDFSVWWR